MTSTHRKQAKQESAPAKGARPIRRARLKQAMLANAKALSARSISTMSLDYCNRRHEARSTESTSLSAP